MAKINITISHSRPKADGRKQIQMRISHRRITEYIGLGISVTEAEWKTIGKSKIYPHLRRMLADAEDVLLGITSHGGGGAMTAASLRAAISERLQIGSLRSVDGGSLLLRGMRRYAETRRAEGTRSLYAQTLIRIQSFDPQAESLSYEDITVDWLTRFDAFLAQTAKSVNARNIHMRNIRAVFNYAIDNELTSAYPFRRFKLRTEPTKKRNLKVEELRRLFDAPVEPYARKYLDIFKLTFFLIGINMVDLCRLKSIERGRIEYRRAKTHRLYSIKVEPEAMEIIEKYRGKGQLLYMMDHYSNHSDYLHRCNTGLRLIGDMKRVGRGGRKVRQPWFPGLSTYWARHSWATIAASLDIPKETISAALGHSTHSVTDIYIEFDKAKIDEANRRVMDWVLYGKR